MAARYRWGDFVLDLDAYELERHGAPVQLEPKALNLLAIMVGRPRHLFTKQEIFQAVWPDTTVTDHALTRVVAQLRRALGDDRREPKYIETVPSRGYRWIAATTLEMDTGAARPGTEGGGPAAAETQPFLPGILGRGARNVIVGVALSAAGLIVFAATGRNPGESNGAAASGEAPAAFKGDGPPQWPAQLTTHAGLDVHPDLSPNGDAVAYASDRTGSFEIFVRAFGGSPGDRPVTGDGGHNVQPAWSPDGRFLAYHSFRRGGIWVVPAPGGAPRQIVATGSKPAWSADGRRIAFQSDEQLVLTPTAYAAQHGSTIWTVGPNGEDPRAVTRSGQPLGGHGAPSWSPDGRYLAFTVFEGGEDDGVWMVRVDTGETTPVVRRHGLFELAFAPDGSALYATTGEAAILRLPIDPAAGTLRDAHGVIPVAGVPGVRGLSMAADGSRAAFAGIALSSQIWAQPVSRDGVPAGRPRALTNDTSHRNSLPAVSPDGRKIAYVSRRSGEPAHVWVMDADGRNGVQLTADDSKDWLASWFPDGRRVAYLSRRGDAPGLWAVDIATRREEQLFAFDHARVPRSPATPVRGTLTEVEFAPSMTRAAFSMFSRPSGRRVIYATMLDRFAPRAVTDDSTSAGYPAWSPDERRLAVQIRDGTSVHAGVVDVETGDVRRLTSDRGQTWARSWSPDGQRIVAAALRHGGWDLRWIDSRTGHQQIITPPGPANVYMRYPEWSPLGDVIVFERGEVRGNIWTLPLR